MNDRPSKKEQAVKTVQIDIETLEALSKSGEFKGNIHDAKQRSQGIAYAVAQKTAKSILKGAS